MKSNIILKVLGGVAVFVLVVLIVVGKKSGEETAQAAAAGPDTGSMDAGMDGGIEGVDAKPLPLVSEQDTSNLFEIDHGPSQADNGLEANLLEEEYLTNEYGVDVDSPVETMRTLTNETRAVREDSVELQNKIKELQLESQRLLKMEETLNKRVESKFNAAAQEAEQKQRELEHTQGLMQGYVERLEAKLKELTEGGLSKPGRKTANGFDINGADIPSGLGFDENGMSVNYDQMVWVNPMDAKVDQTDPNVLSLPDFSTQQVTANLPELASGPVRNNKEDKEDRLIKAYTINADATLVGSVSMTALVGRIPTNGQVHDPYPFKIIVGEDNLSSNGIKIPGVTGIKMTGLAKGDWTMSCVSGQIYSMTFTFQDGTIRTIPEPGTKAKEPLAWLSDDYGIPCMTGERITNAVSFLSSRIGLAAASSWAGAEAAAQVTTTTNGTDSSSALTGDPKVFAKNTAISEGLNEASDWLEERQENSFDAIYAPPGTPVVVHVNEELKIDYDPEGRKVNHYATINNRSKHYLD